MVFFITCLRALAACLITNAHYTGIYPTELIANGGLIGDILFFAVSGYCLCHIRVSFGKWYGHRLWRIYLPTVLITTVYIALGKYNLEQYGAFWWYVYPTYYHFLASIVVLYIPFYFIMNCRLLKSKLPAVMMTVAGVWLGIYVLAYDKSYYHIDVVYEPMIRFLFLESMLLGAWFRQQNGKFRNQPFKWDIAFLIGMAGCYFVSKMAFSRLVELAPLQILNQFVIFALLFFLFRMFMGLDEKLERLPQGIRNVIQFTADLTLEIYLVQYVLIDVLRPIGRFPLNWIIITAAIFASAWVLHKVCQSVYSLQRKWVQRR